MLNTGHIADLIKNGEMGEIKDAMEQSLAPGSQTFEQALYRLYKSEQITIEDALANSDSPTNLHWLISNAGNAAPAEAASTSSDRHGNPRTITGPSEDLSSIKLDLDMV
jgi:twitching motility protein PilU